MTSPGWWPGADEQAGRLPLSALEHYAYCPRQAALIHLDSVFTDNIDTTRGNVAHAHVHEPSSPSPAGGRRDIRVVTGMQVWSDRLHLYGICDAVEIGIETAIPVEHKVGRYVAGGPADVQVAAQALCLDEMLPVTVPYAEVFSHADRRRHRVELTEALLDLVATTAERLRAVLIGGQLPGAVADSRCRRCSLHDDCLPELTNPNTPVDVDLYFPRAAGHWHG